MLNVGQCVCVLFAYSYMNVGVHTSFGLRLDFEQVDNHL